MIDGIKFWFNNLLGRDTRKKKITSYQKQQQQIESYDDGYDPYRSSGESSSVGRMIVVVFISLIILSSFLLSNPEFLDSAEGYFPSQSFNLTSGDLSLFGSNILGLITIFFALGILMVIISITFGFMRGGGIL